MFSKKRVIASACCALFIFLTSCQKDIVSSAPGSSLVESGMVSGNDTINDVPETAYPVHTAIFTAINGNCAGYYQTLPARYALTTKQYPLIVFIHGIGELGTGLKINCCGIPNMANNHKLPAEFVVGGERFSPIYVSPQFKVRPSAADVQAVINYAVAKYRVDPARIYVTGLSMGGGSTIDYANVYGEKVTAIAPVCGGTAATSTIARNIASKNIPVWGIYSTGDQVVPTTWGVNLINWMKADNTAMSSNYKLTIYTGLSHNATWGTAFKPTERTDGYNIYEWLLRFKKGSVPSNSSVTPPVSTPAPVTVPVPVPTPSPVPVTNPAPSPVPVPAPVATSTNKAPTAVAGPDQVISLAFRTNAFLNGAFSKDSDGWLAKYVWTKVSGPATTIATTSLTQAHANNLVVGTYVFRVTVTDNKGATASDDIQVTVTK